MLRIVKFATGKTDCIQFSLQVNETCFETIVHAGSPAFFLSKKTADFLFKSGANVKLVPISEMRIDTHYVWVRLAVALQEDHPLNANTC